MNADERKSADEFASVGSSAPWYEKVFKIQVLVLLTGLATAAPLYMAFANLPLLPRFPWLMPLIKWFLVITSPIVCGGLAIQMFRHLLWLFGRGPFVETWIGPPPRANCVMLGLASMAGGVGIEMERFFPVGIAILTGSIGSFLSLAGFLYAQAEARKSC